MDIINGCHLWSINQSIKSKIIKTIYIFWDPMRQKVMTIYDISVTQERNTRVLIHNSTNEKLSRNCILSGLQTLSNPHTSIALTTVLIIYWLLNMSAFQLRPILRISFKKKKFVKKLTHRSICTQFWLNFRFFYFFLPNII
jgi:hypothetical protein